LSRYWRFQPARISLLGVLINTSRHTSSSEVE
jgi:hypothetical protein